MKIVVVVVRVRIDGKRWRLEEKKQDSEKYL